MGGDSEGEVELRYEPRGMIVGVSGKPLVGES